jgi:hypothetical protein
MHRVLKIWPKGIPSGKIKWLKNSSDKPLPIKKGWTQANLANSI